MIMVLIFFLFTGKYIVQTKMNEGISFLKWETWGEIRLYETLNTTYDSSGSVTFMVCDTTRHSKIFFKGFFLTWNYIYW